VEAASVALHDEVHGDMWFAAASGAASDVVRGKRLAMSHGIIGAVIKLGEPVLVPDVAQDPRFFGGFDQESNFTTRSILCVPLQTKGQTIGAIEVMNKESGPFELDDERLLSLLAAPAAAAIENARLYEQAQREIVERMQAEEALEEERASLARRVAERTSELREANAELAEAARVKDRFVSNASHELRTPLSVITLLSGNLELFYDDWAEEKRRRTIRDIRGQARVLKELIESVLEISRIDSERTSTEFKPVNLTQLAREEVYKQLPLAHEKSQTLHVTGVERLVVSGDDCQLRQIIRNLVSNAIKYTPDGGEITCECLLGAGDRHAEEEWPGMADLPEGRWAALRVVDTGIGVRRENLSKLFERFYRVNEQGNIPGVGLGLSIAEELVQFHSGRIAVASTVGEGTVFAVYLPLSEE
jgi:signal transduction histidine kinase